MPEDGELIRFDPKPFPWWPEWQGHIAAIIGAGPSAKGQPVELLRDRAHVIAVNDSYQLAPWAEVLYSCDANWWILRKGMKDWPGLRLSHDARAHHEFGTHRTQADAASDRIQIAEPGRIGAGGNSGFQALNLAVQFGATKIILVGIDCRLDNPHQPHWHGRHPAPLSNPMNSNCNRWKKAFDGSSAYLQSLGIDVVNCSPVSALQNYPKMTIEQALERFK